MKQSTKRLLSSVLALVFVVAAFVIFFEFIQPAYGDALALRGEERSRSLFLENQRKVIDEVKNLVSAYEGEKDLERVVSAVIPLDPELGEAIAQLNGLAIINKIAPQSFSVTASVIENVAPPAVGGEAPATLIKPIGTLHLQTRLVGSYGDFKAFLRNLESNIRLFDVKVLTLQPAGKPDQDLYAYDLTVATYYQQSP